MPLITSHYELYLNFQLHECPSLKNGSELITDDTCYLLSLFEFHVFSNNTKKILAGKNGTDVVQVFLKRPAFLKRSCTAIPLVPPDARLRLGESSLLSVNPELNLRWLELNLRWVSKEKRFLFCSSIRIISSKTDPGWGHSLHPARDYSHLLFFAPDPSILMQRVPPSPLKAQILPQLHSLSASQWYPVLHAQAGFNGALQTSCSDILGSKKCSGSAPYAPGASWWDFMTLRALLKHTCPNCSAVTLVISWTNTSLTWLDVSACASNAIQYCSALPTCFSRKKKAFKQAGN